MDLSTLDYTSALSDLLAAPPVVPERLSDILGAPKGYEWREQQPELTQKILDSDKPVVMLQAEPGVGKTLMAWAVTQLSPGSSIILVQTRQLERQYLGDHGDLRMIEGRSHFTCNLTGDRASEAPCTVGVRCDLKGKRARGTNFYRVVPTCNYYLTKMKAEQAKASVHNYAYWLGETRYNTETRFKDKAWIVCDEAHQIQQILMASEVIDLRYKQLISHGLLRPPEDSIEKLIAWANDSYDVVEIERNEKIIQARAAGLPIPDDDGEYSDFLEGYEGNFWSLTEDIELSDEMLGMVRQVSAITRLAGDLAGIRAIALDEPDEWIIDTTTDNAVMSIRPIFGKRGFQRIRKAGRRVLLMSAYLAPKLLMENLGLTEDEVEIIEAEAVYDRNKSQILYCPTIKMSFKTSDAQWSNVVAGIDSIIDHYSPGSGLIHVPSLRLRDLIAQTTTHKQQLITYDGESHPLRRAGTLNKDGAIEAFRNAEGQHILLGQSISTGIDIPYVPKFNVIVKVQFPPVVDPAIRARMDVDKLFIPFLTICEIVQAAGRAKRAPDHHCTTIILDRQFYWFYWSQQEHFPAWFSRNLNFNGWSAIAPAYRSIVDKGLGSFFDLDSDKSKRPATGPVLPIPTSRPQAQVIPSKRKATTSGPIIHPIPTFRG
jgi:Rad3-related DNA helicase